METDDRYVYVHVEATTLRDIVDEQKGGITVRVKLDDEGVVVDVATGEDENIGSTWKTYAEMGLKVEEDKEDDEPIVVTARDVAYALCKHCDHFVDTDGYTHLCDEEHHNPDDHHKAEPRGEPRTLEHWRDVRPDLFLTYGDGLVGPNSQFHPTTCDWSKKPG